MGNAVRQDALAVTHIGEKAEGASDDDDFEVWVASRKAKEDITIKGRDGGQMGNLDKVTRDGGAMNGINPTAGADAASFGRQ